MDSLSEFSTLALYSELSKSSPISKDHSLVSIIKFYITLPTTILVTVVIWAFIARVGSMIYIPMSVDLASILTLAGIAVTFVVMLMLVSRAVDALEHEIRYLLEERHHKHGGDNPRKLIWHG